jgi:hypothetical protein
MGLLTRIKPRKKLTLLAKAAAASNAAASAAAASVLVTPKPRGRRPKNTKKKQKEKDRDDRREAALLESAPITDSPPGSPVGPSILACLLPASVSSISSSLRSSNKNKKGKFILIIIRIHQVTFFVWPVKNLRMI